MSRSSDRLVNLFGALVTGAADRVHAAVREQTGLGGETTSALVAIGHAPGLSIDQLRRVLGLSHPGTVRLVDRLTSAGLAARSTSARDRRLVALSLTSAGSAQRAAVHQRRRLVLEELVARVAESDRPALERAAEAVLTALPSDALSALAVCRLCDEASCPDCPMTDFGRPH